MRRWFTSTTRSLIAAMVACALCGGASAGCYHKITRAEGFGADRISTEESDLDRGIIDNAIFGKPAKKSTMPGPGSP